MKARSTQWPLHEAKARLGELFRRVRTEGPQWVVEGGEAVVLVRAEDFDRGSGQARQPASLVEFFRAAAAGAGTLDLTRKRDATRTIKW